MAKFYLPQLFSAFGEKDPKNPQLLLRPFTGMGFEPEVSRTGSCMLPVRRRSLVNANKIFVAGDYVWITRGWL
jgi:hypothetical protein